MFQDINYSYDTADIYDGYIDDYYMDEKWAHTDYPGYLVSNKGRIMHNGYILSDRKGDREGHLAVNIWYKNKQIYPYVHRLVADAFISNPENKPIVRHLNDIPDDNDVNNLAWGTVLDNHYDCVANGKYRAFTDEDREKSYAKSRKLVIAKFPDGSKKKYRSQNDAARELGLQQANIHKVLSGKRKHTGGIIFENG